MIEKTEISVVVKFPYSSETRRYTFLIDTDRAFESLNPLPKNKELFFDDYVEARKQMDMRADQIEYLSRKLSQPSNSLWKGISNLLEPKTARYSRA